MIDKEEIKLIYYEAVLAMLTKQRQGHQLEMFKEYWNLKNYRGAYLFIEELTCLVKNDEYRTADENFYWTFIQ